MVTPTTTTGTTKTTTTAAGTISSVGDHRRGRRNRCCGEVAINTSAPAAGVGRPSHSWSCCKSRVQSSLWSCFRCASKFVTQNFANPRCPGLKEYQRLVVSSIGTTASGSLFSPLSSLFSPLSPLWERQVISGAASRQKSGSNSVGSPSCGRNIMVQFKGSPSASEKTGGGAARRKPSTELNFWSTSRATGVAGQRRTRDFATRTSGSLKRYRGSGGYSQRPAGAFCGDVVAKGTCPSHHTVVAATAAGAAA